MRILFSKAALILLLFAVNICCTKFLDKKPRSNLAVPSSLKDFQALLDQSNNLNFVFSIASEVSADNYYLRYEDWNSLTQEEHKRMYRWENNHLFSEGSSDWLIPYKGIYISNLILENINKVEITSANQSEWNNIKGQALCWRGVFFQNIAFLWSLAYDSGSALSDLGIPLRLNTDFNESSIRSNVQQTYDQIIGDFKEAIPLLPVTPIHSMRPSKPAAYALLARTYLAMRNYDSCLKYADLSYQLKNTLLNFNDPIVSNNVNTNFPFSSFSQFNHPEVLMVQLGSTSASSNILNNSRAKIDSALYQSYSTNDWRKTVFFKNNNNNTYGFKGSFSGTASVFLGPTTGEVYLMRAECLARKGLAIEAMNVLNGLLVKRWKTASWTPFIATDAQDALNKILIERRKELIYRGLRWIDLKRLNKSGANITIARKLNSEVYTLPANDLRYALPIPEDIIFLSGMPQNPR